MQIAVSTSVHRRLVKPRATDPVAAGARLLVPALALVLAACAGEPRSEEVRKLFEKPPREYTSSPLWVWNDRLTDRQITESLEDLAGQGVKQVFVHPRPGLMTPYLSEEWFALWKTALREAERLDMNIWIYDENSYPSGFAGGFVPDEMPESRGRGLDIKEVTGTPKWSETTLAIHAAKAAGFEDVSAKAKAGETLPEGKYYVSSVIRAADSPWHGGKCYVDLLYPGVTQKFLETTLGAYKREVGEAFGERIPGSFTDEPELLPAGGLPWTDDLPTRFQERWGYSLLDNLPSLVRPEGDWKRVRHCMWRTVLELFIERWAKPYHDWCEEEGLAFTGHYWEHEWPRCTMVPDNMALAAWQQMPGIDTLMNQYDEGTHGQFGNVRAVKEISSVANQLGLRRTLCEAYGAGGWDLRFEDMKRISDWLQVLGVNFIDEHLSYVTLRGARKKDHPQSFSHHEPWWEAYHVRADYVARLSAALSQGKQVNPFLILEPTTTAWLYQADPAGAAHLEEIGNGFQDLLLALERAQVEYDLGCEDIIASSSPLGPGKLRIGERSYDAVVIPPLVESIDAPTASRLEAFVRGGGVVLCCGDPPALVEGRPSGFGAGMAKEATWRKVAPSDVPGILSGMTRDGFAIRRASGDAGILFHHRRRLPDGELLFLVNTKADAPSKGSVSSLARGLEEWNPYDGKTSPRAFRATGEGIEFDFELPPSGSLLLFLSNEPKPPGPAPREVSARIEPSGPMAIRRLEPNVLVIDYLDVAAGGEARKGIHSYAAQQFAFQKNGLERNPWDSAVQFRDEFIRKTFPAESGFEATYRFTIEESVPPGLEAVVEYPSLYSITLNGKPVEAASGKWWLDRSFGRIAIDGVAAVGENLLVLKARPFTVYHEIEPVYILGGFSLKTAESGFAIVPEKPLELGPWNEQGHPFYGAGVAYGETFEISDPASAGGHAVKLVDALGSVARVVVNGKEAGWIDAPPWRLEVGTHLVAGKNRVEVTILGTLRNLLGPLHAGPALGSAWPSMFHQAPASGPPPGAQYSTIVGYGMKKPFIIESETKTMTPNPSPNASDDRAAVESAARGLIAEHEAGIRPLEIALSREWWNANVTGRDDDFAAKEKAQNELDAALADKARFVRLEALDRAAAGGSIDPLLARQVRILHLQALEKQVDPELLRKMSARSNAVEKTFNLFRAKVDGKELTDSEVRKILKESKDGAQRKAVWEANKRVGAAVQDDLRELVKLRNEAARKLGYSDYHVLQLHLAEQDQAEIFRLFDELHSLTKEPFAAAKAEIDARLASSASIATSELRPWHYQDPFFQEAPAIYDTDLDLVYAKRDILDLSRRFYASIGLPIDAVLERSDLYEKPGKSPHAFMTDIDREGDVRVLANIVANEYWMGTMLHELGHAVYSSRNIPRSLPYLLRTEAHTLSTEGMAMLFEKFSRDARWLESLGAAPEDPKAFHETALKLRRNQLLVFAAWCQVMFRFEAAMYADPDQDLNRLWWDLVERYQLLRRPEGRNEPDFASKIHIVSAPAYYHNYLMGQLFASQLHHAIARDVLHATPEDAVYTGRAEVGDFLRAKVFSVGRSLDWRGLARHATGEDLNAKAFAADFRKS